MAHMIEGNKMFYAGEVPWHGLGVGVEEAPTSAEAIRLAQLDTTVKLMPAYVKIGRKFIEASEWRGIVRVEDDRVLGMASPEYSPFQNLECFEFMDELVASGDLKYESAGSLFGGKKVFITARIPDDIIVGGRDKVYKYLLLYTGHDRKTSLQVVPTSVRPVCWNTVNMALGEASRGATRTSGRIYDVNIKHRGSLKERVSQARQLLRLSAVEFRLFEQAAGILDERDGLPQVDKFLRALFPPPEKDAPQQVKSAHDAAVVAIGQNLKAEAKYRGGNLSAWSLLQGVTGYIDHRASSHTRKDGLALDRNMRSVLLGRKAAKKEEALNLILQMNRIYDDIREARERMLVKVAKKA
jgi:phage/plasmid-like protein (TIGR03299 family)